MARPQAKDAALSDQLADLLEREQPERVVVVTGAGISAESGIPTFRGAEGYWTVGAREYHPQELATQAAFQRMPRAVWRWYLYRKGVCNHAQPNAAHAALVELERALGDRFCLVTQNVDGLHLRAGNSPERTMQVHGNTDYMRPLKGDPTPMLIPAGLPLIDREDPLDEATWALLVSPDGRRARPHVLWFDEYYNEELYRADSAIAAGKSCDLLVVVGTSGAAAIPYHLAALALANDAAIIDINPDPNPFSDHALDRASKHKGLWLRGPGTRWVPELVERLKPSGG